jgi:hypothetical protein
MDGWLAPGDRPDSTVSTPFLRYCSFGFSRSPSASAWLLPLPSPAQPGPAMPRRAAPRTVSGPFRTPFDARNGPEPALPLPCPALPGPASPCPGPSPVRSQPHATANGPEPVLPLPRLAPPGRAQPRLKPSPVRSEHPSMPATGRSPQNPCPATPGHALTSHAMPRPAILHRLDPRQPRRQRNPLAASHLVLGRQQRRARRARRP